MSLLCVLMWSTVTTLSFQTFLTNDVWATFPPTQITLTALLFTDVSLSTLYFFWVIFFFLQSEASLIIHWECVGVCVGDTRKQFRICIGKLDCRKKMQNLTISPTLQRVIKMFCIFWQNHHTLLPNAGGSILPIYIFYPYIYIILKASILISFVQKSLISFV